MTAHLPLKDHIFISEFAAFCRSKGDERYDYGLTQYCALAQFLRHSGRAERPCVADGARWFDLAGDLTFQSSPDGVHAALTPGLFGDLGAAYTFSALATRLESLLSDMTVGVGL